MGVVGFVRLGVISAHELLGYGLGNSKTATPASRRFHGPALALSFAWHGTDPNPYTAGSNAA